MVTRTPAPIKDANRAQIIVMATSPILPKNDHYAAVKLLWDADSQNFLEAIWAPAKGEWRWVVIQPDDAISLIKAGWTCVHTRLSSDPIVDAVEGSNHV